LTHYNLKKWAKTTPATIPKSNIASGQADFSAFNRFLKKLRLASTWLTLNDLPSTVVLAITAKTAFSISPVCSFRPVASSHPRQTPAITIAIFSFKSGTRCSFQSGSRSTATFSPITSSLDVYSSVSLSKLALYNL